MLKKRTSTLLLFIVVLAASVFGISLRPTSAHALSGSSFSAGQIIDDGVFYNSNSMNSGEVQAFLNAKVPACDTNGSQNSSHWNSSANRYYTRAEWGSLNGNPAPYPCLRDYSQSIGGTSADAYCSGSISAGTKTAAQIIVDVSSACGVSSKALIVLLEKEQSLVTDDWPWAVQYRSATGYGCPDTAACDAAYYGFFNQVYNAARQFQRYAKQSQSFNYRANRTSYIQYNPNASCGGSNVAILNNATAGLYNYTPYQPNASALNNLYGSGDSCGAYGNRNFWRLFNDWFGSTYAPAYAWTVAGQFVVTDQTMATPASTNLLPGQRVYLVIKARNIGNVTWSNGGSNPMRVGASRPNDRGSAFCDSTWLNSSTCNRTNNMLETSVAPGEIGTFGFWIKAPTNGLYGSFNEYFNLVSDGITWLNDTGVYWTITVNKPNYSWSPTSQTVYTDNTKSTQSNLLDMLPGTRRYVVVRAKNNGNMTWTNSGSNPIRLGTFRNMDRASGLCDSTWLGPNCNRPALMSESSVAPGGTATFEFWTTATGNGFTGASNEYFNLVSDGLSWMNDAGMYWTMTITKPVYSWKVLSQEAFTDNNATTPVNTSNLNVNQRFYIRFRAQNLGNTTWQKSVAYKQVNAGASKPNDRISPFCDSSWLANCNRAATTAESTVAPGATGTFGFWVTAPSSAGTRNEYYNLVMDGVTWLNDPGMYWSFTTH